MIPRLLTILVGVPIVLACTYFGGVPFFILVLVLAAVSINEFYSLIQNKGVHPSRVVGNIFTIIFISFAQQTLKHPNWEPAAAAILTGASILTFSAGILLRKTTMATLNIAVTLLGMIYVGWLFSYLILLRSMGSHGIYLFYLMISIWMMDTSAYLAGSRLGRTLLSPYISPKKTVEGAVAGFLVCVAVSWFFAVWQSWPLLPFLGLGALIGIMGQISDLVESLIKRDSGVKDSSPLIPGHGGVLDRMDSFILTAPLVYYYLSWLIF